MILSSRARLGCSAIVVFALASVATAADWRPLIAQLSSKISAATGPGVIALEITNRSSISSPDVEAIRRELTSLLATSGVRVWQPEQAAGTVKITLSESLQNYVWVAEIHQGADETFTVIVSTPRTEPLTGSQNTMPLTLHATPLVSQQEPILDAAVIEGSPRRMLVLSASAVTIYEFRNGGWIAGQSLAISHDHPFPRDLRGRIILRKDHLFDAYLPGVICHSTNASPPNMSCSPSDDPWPLVSCEAAMPNNSCSTLSAFFAPNRNFFTGAFVPGIGKQRSAPAFYSAASVPKDNYSLWALAGIDGQVHLLDGINQQTLPKIHWGSDIAAVHATCRQASQILATSAEDNSADTIQAFEFPDREPVAVSNKIEVNGEITVLWAAQSGDSAIVVFRNQENGNYEADLLNLACGQ